MSAKLGMNPKMGKKWFIFYAKVRPVLSVLMILPTFFIIAQNLNVYLEHIGLIISVLASIAAGILSIIVAVKSNDDYEEFVLFVNEVLIFEIFNMGYQAAAQQYYQNGYDIATCAIIGLIILVFSYFAWYRPNIKYFRRRLIVIHTEVTSTYQQHTAALEQSSIEESVTNISKKAARYCSRCGNPIDPVTKQCLGCKKQYFKGISCRKIFTILLILLLICSLVLNLDFYVTCKEILAKNTELTSENEILSKKVTNIQKETSNLEKELKASYRLFEEINELVVFVEDDGTRLYHRFLCEKFKGESFWAFNIDAAEGKGYKPCTLCSNTSFSSNWNDSFTQLLIETIVGEDYEISTEELKEVVPSALASLASLDVVLSCSSWKGLYHSISCERLTGNCTVTIRTIAKANGLRPCPVCQD